MIGQQLDKKVRSLIHAGRYNPIKNPISIFQEHPYQTFLTPMIETMHAMSTAAFFVAIAIKVWDDQNIEWSLFEEMILASFIGVGFILMGFQHQASIEAQYRRYVPARLRVRRFEIDPHNVRHMVTEVPGFYKIAMEVINHMPHHCSDELVEIYRLKEARRIPKETSWRR